MVDFSDVGGDSDGSDSDSGGGGMFEDVGGDTKDDDSTSSSVGGRSDRSNVFLTSRHGTKVVPPTGCELCDKVGRVVLARETEADSMEFRVSCHDHEDNVANRMPKVDFTKEF